MFVAKGLSLAGNQIFEIFEGIDAANGAPKAPNNYPNTIQKNPSLTSILNAKPKRVRKL